MKKYLYINILVLSSQMFSVGAQAGEVWGFPWYGPSNPDQVLRRWVIAQEGEDEREQQALDELEILAEEVAEHVLNEGEQAQFQAVAHHAANNVLSESDEGEDGLPQVVVIDALNNVPAEERSFEDSNPSSEECAEESAELCEEVCNDDVEEEGSQVSTTLSSAATTVSSNEENRNPKYKTVLCKHYMSRGECRNGKACKFAHGKMQLQQNNGKYKTQMCRNWKRFGRCFYGEKCDFAHGDGELRK